MYRLAFLSFLFATPLAAQGVAATTPPPTASVPTWPNATCPIMGKPVSMSLFVDTDLGRVYLCCKPCAKKVLADVPTAHKTAYPVVGPSANATCPISGEPIGTDAVTMTLQEHRFQVCCAACLPIARREAQVTLAKVTAAVVDLGNEACPITGEPVTANAFVVIDDTVVRLSSTKVVADAAKAPAATLAKARERVQTQPPRGRHEHAPKAEASQ